VTLGRARQLIAALDDLGLQARDELFAPARPLRQRVAEETEVVQIGPRSRLAR